MDFKVGVGKSDFDELRRSGNYYVDKTELIYELVNNTDNKVIPTNVTTKGLNYVTWITGSQNKLRRGHVQCNSKNGCEQQKGREERHIQNFFAEHNSK